MQRFLIRKLVQGVLLVIVVSAAAFALLSAAGGDALAGLRENPQVSAETIERLSAAYGLDRPMPERFARWAAGAVQGDLGESITFRTPVLTIVAARLIETVKLAALTLAIVLAVSLSLAFFGVRYQSRVLSRLIESGILVSASTPVIVTSLTVLALAAAFSAASGAGSLLLSAAALSPPFIAVFLAQAGKELGIAMREDFVRTARAKGLSENAVILRHASRVALNPLITLTGLSVGALVSGSVIVETVLGRQGIGSLTVTAVRGRDVPLVMGIVLVVSIAVWLGNALGELAQILNDRRMLEAERE